MLQVRGVYTALVTPFDETGEVNYDALGEIIERQVAAGVAGVVPMGTTGESPTMFNAEHDEVMRYTVEKGRRSGPGLGRDRLEQHPAGDPDHARGPEGRRRRCADRHAVLQQAQHRPGSSAISTTLPRPAICRSWSTTSRAAPQSMSRPRLWPKSRSCPGAGGQGSLGRSGPDGRCGGSHRIAQDKPFYGSPATMP
jgi:hypothetical protein